jgi:predicted RNA-binding Zn ribbon-like protein
MTYSMNYPVKLIAGRLALDFLNTANWTSDGSIAQEKISCSADLQIWLDAAGLQNAKHPDSIEELIAFRGRLRSAFFDNTNASELDLGGIIGLVEFAPESTITKLRSQSILSLIAISALSILSDTREMDRVKTCPGIDCGWKFIDETKNARRKWCSMELCGNRAKASRNYARKTQKPTRR